ncbi:MAG: winged helix-turn-helix domain-containing protein [Patescibacteria group bacterium]|nr:winged helix-turn-helix domain-containing protein [Patescibacteria group bacterium]
MYELIQSKKWAKRLSSRMKTYIKRGDNINVWGLPTVGTSSFLRALANTSEDVTFIYFDTHMSPITSSKSFHNLLTLQISQIARPGYTEEIKNPTILKTHSLIKSLTKDKPVCIIIDTIDNLTTLDEKFLSSLNALRNKFIGSLGLIFVSSRPLHEHPHFSKYKSFIDFAAHNEIISEPFERKDLDPLLEPLRNNFDVKITPELLDKLIELSGGIFGLLKSTLRFLETKGSEKIDLKQILKEPSIITRLDRIYSSFSRDEKRALKALALGKKGPQVKTRYLLESGIIDQKGIKSSLFKMYLANSKPSIHDTKLQDRKKTKYSPKSSGINIDTESGEIFRNGKRFPEILSDTELKILNHMKDSKSVTTRDDLAKIIWGKNYLDEYSDWAIDKTISRIRAKLMDRKRPYKYLVTIKGKGFKLHLP